MQNLVRSVGQAKGTECVNEVRKLYVEIVLKAVAERVSKGVVGTDMMNGQTHAFLLTPVP